MKATKSAALILSLLVIMLPVTFAQQITIEKYSGRDNADGYVRSSNDLLTVTAIAEMQGNPSLDVAKTRVKFCMTETACINFNTCTVESNEKYRCTYTTADLPNSGEEAYSIRLYDVNGNEISSKEITIHVDRAAPGIVYFEIEPKISREGDAKIKYRAEDYSAAAGDISYCSGLKEIRITANNQTVKAEGTEAGVCGKEEEIEYTYQTSSSYEEINYCIKATDYLGMQSTQRCQKAMIDNSPPRITALKIKDPQGYEFTHIKSGQAITADIHVTIESEGDVEKSAVKATLSSLNPGLGERIPDDKIGNEYIWRSITITNPESCTVPVKANDIIGNEASATMACSLPIDDSRPIPAALLTDAADLNATPMLSKNGTIYAELTESGSGMDKGDAYLDLHKIGLGTGVKANLCENTGPDQWRCTWKNVKPTVASGTYSITLTQQTKDDLGNPADKNFEATVIVDKTAPVIANVIATFMHQTADYGPRAVNGDSIEFIFNVTGAAEAYADLSYVGGAESVPATECTEDSCKFDVLIDASGPQNTTIAFEFFDLARNKETYRYSFFIYGLLNDTLADYWTSRVSCSPSMIDRNTAAFHEHPVYCQVKLTPKNKVADAVYAEPGDLTDCTGNFSYVTEIEAVNNQFGSKSPYLVFTLAAAEYNVNDLKFSCPVFVTTRIGNYFTPYAEREDVNITLNFYNLPYGEMYSNTEKRIKETMKKNAEWAQWIGDVENVFDQARKYCNWKTDFTALLSAIDAVLDVFVFVIPIARAAEGGKGTYADELEKARVDLCNGKGPIMEFIEGQGEKIKPEGSDISAGDLWNIMDLMCKFANCQLTAEDVAGKENYKELVKSSDIIGAWDSVCKGDVQTLGLSLDLKEYEQGDVKPKKPVNIKESLIMSTICLCVPGVAYNLEKMRQIRCQYAYCLGTRVLRDGLPRSYCDDEKAYLTCNYVTGQIFEIMPFAWLHNQVSSMFQEFYANPISALAAVAGCLCGGCSKITGFDYCAKDTPGVTGKNAWQYAACSVVKTAAKIGDAIASIKTMTGGGDYWQPKPAKDWCKEAEEIIE